MKTKHALPFSQEPVTGSYPEEDEAIPRPRLLFQINFNSILPATSGDFKGIIPFRFSIKIFYERI